MKTAIDRFNEKCIAQPSGCWIWTSTVKNTGYGGFWLDGSSIGAHRAAWLLLVGEIPNSMMVCHHCDTPLCVNPAHLFLGTVLDNIADRTAKGRDARGERQGLAKLTPAKAAQIFLAEGVQREIAERFGVHQSQVSNIKRRITWRHATDGLFA